MGQSYCSAARRRSSGTIGRERRFSNGVGAARHPRWDAYAQEAWFMRKTLAGAAWLFVLALVLAACGGNDDGGSGTAAPAEPATTAAPATTADPAAGGTTVAVASDGKLGDILVDGDGRTLYAFTKDQGDKSACSGQCADNWPALEGTATAGTGVDGSLLSSAMQASGDTQVTYGGRPLYYFAGDAKPGDVNGQGVGNVWFVVTAGGDLVKEKASGGAYP